jgi:hypothetical protein
MLTKVFLLLLVLAVWFQLKSSEGFTPLWATEDKVDYAGSDIDTMTGTLNNCKTKCITNTNCKGIVADFSDGSGTCWLKSAFGTSTPNDARFAHKLTRR